MLLLVASSGRNSGSLDLTVLLTGLLGALIGALIGALALIAAQGWQLWSSRRDAQAAARLIYLEIAYNLSILRTVGTTTTPIPLLVVDSLWREHAGKLVTVMHEREIGHVAFAYVQLESHRWFFSQPWYYLAINRLRGDDVNMIDRLSKAFVEAEAALRPKVWTGERLTALSKAMRIHAETISRPSASARLAAAFRTVPVSFLFAAAVALFLFDQAVKVWRTLRGRATN